MLGRSKYKKKELSQHNESLENRGQHRFFSFSVNNYDSCFPNNIMLRFNFP